MDHLQEIASIPDIIALIVSHSPIAVVNMAPLIFRVVDSSFLTALGFTRGVHTIGYTMALHWAERGEPVPFAKEYSLLKRGYDGLDRHSFFLEALRRCLSLKDGDTFRIFIDLGEKLTHAIEELPSILEDVLDLCRRAWGFSNAFCYVYERWNMGIDDDGRRLIDIATRMTPSMELLDLIFGHSIRSVLEQHGGFVWDFVARASAQKYVERLLELGLSPPLWDWYSKSEEEGFVRRHWRPDHYDKFISKKRDGPTNVPSEVAATVIVTLPNESRKRRKLLMDMFEKFAVPNRWLTFARVHAAELSTFDDSYLLEDTKAILPWEITYGMERCLLAGEISEGIGRCYHPPSDSEIDEWFENGGLSYAPSFDVRLYYSDYGLKVGLYSIGKLVVIAPQGLTKHFERWPWPLAEEKARQLGLGKKGPEGWIDAIKDTVWGEENIPASTYDHWDYVTRFFLRLEKVYLDGTKDHLPLFYQFAYYPRILRLVFGWPSLQICFHSNSVYVRHSHTDHVTHIGSLDVDFVSDNVDAVFKVIERRRFLMASHLLPWYN